MNKRPTFVPLPSVVPPVETQDLSIEQRALLFQSVGLLLSYPQDNWPAVLEAVKEASMQLPRVVGIELAKFYEWAEENSQSQVEQLYVETFDQKRRCSLELTYYATGDTRQRGIALTVFQDLYAALGWELDNLELPDYLPNVLEIAARVNPDDIELVDQVLASCREGIEILHAALESLNSPWAGVIASLRMGIPPIDEETTNKIQDLIRQGPPQEIVGRDDLNSLPWPTSNQTANSQLGSQMASSLNNLGKE